MKRKPLLPTSFLRIHFTMRWMKKSQNADREVHQKNTPLLISFPTFVISKMKVGYSWTVSHVEWMMFRSQEIQTQHLITAWFQLCIPTKLPRLKLSKKWGNPGSFRTTMTITKNRTISEEQRGKFYMSPNTTCTFVNDRSGRGWLQCIEWKVWEHSAFGGKCTIGTYL